MTEPPRRSHTPEPGYYLRRIVRGGPWIGCQITFEPAEGYRVMQDGRWEGPSHEPWTLPLMHDVAFAKRSTRTEVEYRIGIKRWSEIYAPDHPAANPRKPID